MISALVMIDGDEKFVIKRASDLKAPPSCAACTNNFCSNLLPDTKDKICRSRSWVNYSRKNQQAFFLENRQILILESGCIIALRMDEKARQQSIDLLGSGDLLGIVNVFNTQSQREYFQIMPLTDCSGCMLPISAMEALILERQDLCKAFIAQFSSRFSRVVDNLMIKTLDSAEDRVANAEALFLAHGIAKYSHEELALLAGLNRVTVTRILNQRRGIT